MTQQLLDTQEPEIITELDFSHVVLEDDTPADNFQSELQQRLLMEPICSSKALPVHFLAAANVGLFYKLKRDSVVPDMLVSLGGSELNLNIYPTAAISPTLSGSLAKRLMSALRLSPIKKAMKSI